LVTKEVVMEKDAVLNFILATAMFVVGVASTAAVLSLTGQL
jgi:hypothetical protein